MKTNQSNTPNTDTDVGVWDSVLLELLTEDAFINNLHQRYKRDHIYVRVLKFGAYYHFFFNTCNLFRPTLEHIWLPLTHINHFQFIPRIK